MIVEIEFEEEDTKKIEKALTEACDMLNEETFRVIRKLSKKRLPKGILDTLRMLVFTWYKKDGKYRIATTVGDVNPFNKSYAKKFKDNVKNILESKGLKVKSMKVIK